MWMMATDIIPAVTKKSFTVRMDADHLDRLDHARGDVPRERFVRRAIEAAVQAVEAEQARPRKAARTMKTGKR